MAATDRLKCQFCSLGFASVYKIIPHIYFGHRKKISKYVREHGEVMLRCPAGCDFSSSRSVEKTAGPESVFPALSMVLGEQEDHMTNQHTEENKLAVCPYCQISLDTVVYWEHLEEHMGSTATVRTTPTKPVVPTQNQQESCASGTKKNLSTIESKDSTSNQTPNQAPNQCQIETSTKAETIPSVSKVTTAELQVNVTPSSSESPTMVSTSNVDVISASTPQNTTPTDISKSVVKDVIRDVAKDTGNDASKDALKDDPKDVAKDVPMDVCNDDHKDAAKNVASIPKVVSAPEAAKPFTTVPTTESSVIQPPELTPKVDASEQEAVSSSSAQEPMSEVSAVKSEKDIPKSPETLTKSSSMDTEVKVCGLSSPEGSTKIATSDDLVTTRPPEPAPDIQTGASLVIPSADKSTPVNSNTVFPPSSDPDASTKASAPDQEAVAPIIPLHEDAPLIPNLDPELNSISTSAHSPESTLPDSKIVNSVTSSTQLVSATVVASNVPTPSLSAPVSPEISVVSTNSSSPSLVVTTTTTAQMTQSAEIASKISEDKTEAERKKQIKQEEIRNQLREIERKIAEKKKEEKLHASKSKKEALSRASKEESAAKATKEEVLANAAKEEALLMVAKEALTKSKQDALAKVSEKETITNTSKQKDQSKIIDPLIVSKPFESKEEVKENTSKTIGPKNKVAEAIEAKIEEIEREERERLAKEAKEKESLKNMSKEENVEVSRHISNRRMSSDQGIRHEERTRRESGRSGSGGGAWTPTEIPAVKPKPVLTEEMERQIIYGSFKKKESREDKLKAVKKEIELRFKEEEEKRRREKEEREERDRKERNKQRLQDEKMKKVLKEKKEANKKRKIEEKLEKVEKVEQSDEASSEAEPKVEVGPVETVPDSEAVEEEMLSSPTESKEKISTNPYQRIKDEIMKMEKEKQEIDRKKKLDKEEEVEELSPVVSVAPRAIEETRTVRIVSPAPEDDDIDDLEMLMRDFKEAESKEKASLAPQKLDSVAPNKDSLAILRDNYAKKNRSPSPSAKAGPTIPAGFDKDGHPLPVTKHLGQDPMLIRAANNAAKTIMGPARRTDKSLALQLQCSLCKEDGSSASYVSAYQLLSHVFLAHRKKIVSRSRKARGMTLACPEGCGFVTRQSAQGVSIDFFNAQLPNHLESLCEHIISDHTGEDRMGSCHFCDLPLSHREAWSWQHLANHRDARRQFCETCKTFPFKNEVHRCSGSAEVQQPPKKTLEELARDVQAGMVDPEELTPQKHLGNISEWSCPVCPRSHTRLSSWLHHLRLDHFGKNSGRLVFSLKCFCCTWKPLKAAQRDRENDALAVEQLMTHLVSEHGHQSWEDREFDCERGKVESLAREREKKQEREREEAEIQVPKLPATCSNCDVMCKEAQQWKYHVLAHKFGEVFCSSCRTCILGHQFTDHKAACVKAEGKVQRVKVERYRGDTWLDVGGKKLKVFFEYDESEELGTGSVTIAKCNVKGNLPIMGVGLNHEEAANLLKEEVEDYFATLKDQEDDSVDKEALARADRQELLDMFIELARIDQEEAKKKYSVRVRGIEIPVMTAINFTKTGCLKVTASITLGSEEIRKEGDTKEAAVKALTSAVRKRGYCEEENREAKFCCVTCGTRFLKEIPFQLHQEMDCGGV